MTVLRRIELFAFLAAAASCGPRPPASPGQAPDSGEVSDGGAAGDGGLTSDAGSPGDGGAAADAGPPTGVVAVSLTGCPVFYFLAPVTIGGQTFNLLLDTGSETVAIAGVGCSECLDAGETDLYRPGPTATDEKRTATASYGNGSETYSGEVYQDQVQIDPAAPVAMDLVSIETQTNFFPPPTPLCDGSDGGAPLRVDGIIGLGTIQGVVAGTNDYLDQAVDGGPETIALRFCHAGGKLWLGGFDPSSATAPPTFTSTFTAGFVSGGDYLELTGLSVGQGDAGTAVALSGAITSATLDTGISSLGATTAIFNPLVAAIGSDPTFSRLFGGASFFSNGISGSCQPLPTPPDQLDGELPPIVARFGSSVLSLPATTSYLIWFTDLAGGYLYCPNLQEDTNSSDGDLFIMGNTPFLSNVVILDRKDQQVGFAPATPCP
ncbi:MAG: pepsin-like aspartic protease [Deltaproteobacteria bacterium]